MAEWYECPKARCVHCEDPCHDCGTEPGVCCDHCDDCAEARSRSVLV